MIIMKPNKGLIGIPLLAAVAGILLFAQTSNDKNNAVSVEEARKIIAADSTVLVLDVRTPEEYTGQLGHIDHALLIPVQELEKRIGELEEYKGKTVLAVCRTGRRSGSATDLLKEKGFTVKNVEGGMVKWNEENLPVVKETK